MSELQSLSTHELLSDRDENVSYPTNIAKLDKHRIGGGAPTWVWNIRLVWHVAQVKCGDKFENKMRQNAWIYFRNDYSSGF